MIEEQAKKAQQQWTKIITKAWADEDFKVRLIGEPAAVLKEEGIVVPDGITIKVMEDRTIAWGELVICLSEFKDIILTNRVFFDYFAYLGYECLLIRR